MDLNSEGPSDILHYTGDIGTYQIWLFAVLFPMVYMSVDTTPMIFFGGIMDHWCLINSVQNYSFAQQQYIAIPNDEDTNTGFDECYHFPLDFENYTDADFQSWGRDTETEGLEPRDYLPCTEWVYDRSVYRSTITSRWDLVCDNSWKVSMVSTFTMAGKLVGSIVCGAVSDRFGRLLGTLIFLGVMFIGSLLTLFSPGYITYCFARVLVGAGVSGSNLCAFVLITEVLSSKYRSSLGVVWNIGFSVAYMSLPLFAFFLRSEDSLQAVYTWTLLPFFLFALTLQESPRWLLSKNRDKEAEEIIHFIAKVNKKELPVELDFSRIKSNFQKEKNTSHSKARLGDLFTHPTMRRITLIVYFNWFANSLVYYGLSLNTGALAVNIYINTFLMGAVEIPANILAIYLIGKIGRTWTIGWSCVFAGIFSLICVILIIFDVPPQVLTIFSILGKGCMTMAFSGAYVYAIEIFPTPVRNLGIGSSSMCARISGMAAPFVGVPLADVWAPLPSLIFAVFSLVSGVLMFLPPDTLNRKLPETLEEIEKFGKSGTIFNKATELQEQVYRMDQKNSKVEMSKL